MEGKERSARNREISLAGLATEAQRAIRATALIGVQAAAMWADRRAVSLWPAHLAKHCLGFRVRHAEDLSEAQGLCRAGKEEMLRHTRVSNDLVRSNMTLYWRLSRGKMSDMIYSGHR